MKPRLALPLLCLSFAALACAGLADSTHETNDAPVPAPETLLDSFNSRMQQASTLDYEAQTTFQFVGSGSVDPTGKGLPKHFLLSVKGFVQKKSLRQEHNMFRLTVTLDGKPYRLLVQNQERVYDYAVAANRYRVFDTKTGTPVNLKGPISSALFPALAYMNDDAHALLIFDPNRDFPTGMVSSSVQPASSWKIIFAPDATAKTDPVSGAVVTTVKQSDVSLDKITGLVTRVKSSWYQFLIIPKNQNEIVTFGYSIGIDFSQFHLGEQLRPVSAFNWTPPKGAKEDPTLDNA